MSDISIRRGRVSDSAVLAALFRRSRAQAMPWLPVLHTAEDVERFMTGTVLAEQEVWVAEAAGEPVGFAAVHAGMLDHLYIRPDWQRQGIGTALLDAALVGRDRLELWVFQRNTPARAFYEEHGFTLVELTDGQGNEERTPDARYAWRRRG